MLSPLMPAERTRLVSILGMLGSDFDGERAAAGLLAARLLRDRGLSWDDLISYGGDRLGGSASSDSPGMGPGWQTALVLCQRHQSALSDWEARFVADMRGRRTPPSLRQMAKLVQIADALRARGLA